MVDVQTYNTTILKLKQVPLAEINIEHKKYILQNSTTGKRQDSKGIWYVRTSC